MTATDDFAVFVIKQVIVYGDYVGKLDRRRQSSDTLGHSMRVSKFIHCRADMPLLHCLQGLVFPGPELRTAFAVNTTAFMLVFSRQFDGFLQSAWLRYLDTLHDPQAYFIWHIGHIDGNSCAAHPVERLFDERREAPHHYMDVYHRSVAPNWALRTYIHGTSCEFPRDRCVF
jgi:hypothetical protein